MHQTYLNDTWKRGICMGQRNWYSAKCLETYVRKQDRYTNLHNFEPNRALAYRGGIHRG